MRSIGAPRLNPLRSFSSKNLTGQARLKAQSGPQITPVESHFQWGCRATFNWAGPGGIPALKRSWLNKIPLGRLSAEA